MKIKNVISRLFARGRKNEILDTNMILGGGLFQPIETQPFSQLVWQNVTELLIDLVQETTLNRVDGDLVLFASLSRMFDADGKLFFSLLLRDGYVVVGRRDGYVWIMNRTEYQKNATADGVIVADPIEKGVIAYVVTSDTMKITGKSDKELCFPVLRYIDSVMSASVCTHERLGVAIVCSPESETNSPTRTYLDEDDRKDMEKTLQDEYGSLKRQRSVAILSRPMKIQPINLAALDLKTQEKLRSGILLICDRIKVPANQVAFVDAYASKALSNGSEIVEGDKMRYRSFRRLLTYFWWLAMEMGVEINFVLENEPK